MANRDRYRSENKSNQQPITLSRCIKELTSPPISLSHNEARYFLREFFSLTCVDLVSMDDHCSHTLLQTPICFSSTHLSKAWKQAKKKLAAQTPISYVLGKCYFWNDAFYVGKGVLTPRKETEHIVEYILDSYPLTKYPFLKVSELGGGSGNIGLSILKERPTWRWITFEKSKQALPYLSKNRDAILPTSLLREQMIIVPGDYFNLSLHQPFLPYDLFVSNPPYVASKDKSSLPHNVCHEPHMSLYGGKDGSLYYQKLSNILPKLLGPSQEIIMEIDPDLTKKIEKIFYSCCKNIIFHTDYQKHNRFFSAVLL